MNLEISYVYTHDKYSTPETSWTYFSSKSDDLKEAITEAGKHFKKFVTANRWGRQVKLKSIATLKDETTPPDHRVNTTDSPTRRSSPKKKRAPSSSRTRKNKKSV